VDGYRLPIGANVDENLRKEIFESTTFIGLLSESSLRSTYVLFELGARWGANKPSPILLLMSDISQIDLKPPISGYNALQCDKRSNLQQLIYEIAQSLNLTIGNPVVYERAIQKIIETIKKPLVIFQPSNGDIVPLRPIIDGQVRDSNSEVWLIVRPVGSTNYWVQPKAEVKSTGKWTAQIYIGREGTEDIGNSYEIRAVANPEISFKRGDILKSWPSAKYKSDVIKLTRG
jgi:hypothetical protein